MARYGKRKDSMIGMRISWRGMYGDYTGTIVDTYAGSYDPTLRVHIDGKPTGFVATIRVSDIKEELG